MRIQNTKNESEFKRYVTQEKKLKANEFDFSKLWSIKDGFKTFLTNQITCKLAKANLVKSG